ncbi:hypothetical protein AVEN_155449-1 [Araneus ventricosus]|uniref:RNase H type-1 domain-containing protein n=1 Tax=Araneus ventricosus TaxID=182803 RepID=A0A4Y2NEI1_ARAVE|nr:hypothetical protein AVEN_155449-1 [Araneus ventricosus]
MELLSGGGSFIKQQITDQHSVQRVALLKISKSYRTCQTNTLNVLWSLPPVHVVANALYITFQVWQKRNMNFDFIDVNHLDSFIKVNNININQRILEFSTLIESPDFEVYTDGSEIGDNVAAAVCIFKDNDLFESFQYKLASYNSVFQAELAAINFAACWALENGYKVNIFTDSLSSIEVLKKANSKSLFLNHIKSKMFQAIGSVGLSWVKAHSGISGN